MFQIGERFEGGHLVRVELAVDNYQSLQRCQLLQGIDVRVSEIGGDEFKVFQTFDLRDSFNRFV